MTLQSVIKESESEVLHPRSEPHLLEMANHVHLPSEFTKCGTIVGIKRKRCTVSPGFETIESTQKNCTPEFDHQDFHDAPPSGVAIEVGATPTTRSSSKSICRSVRYKRQLEKAGADCEQTKITDHFEILNEIEACLEKLLLENEKNCHLCCSSMLITK